MGSTAATALLLLLIASVPAVLAVTFQVGDAAGWTSGIDYSVWVTGKTFRVGDTLEFQYGPSHSVSVVDKAGHDNCDASGATGNFFDGDTKIDLSTVGTTHFLCPVFGHCLGGMKLAVPVLAAASSPSTPSSPPSPLKTSSPPPSASPPANDTPESEPSMPPLTPLASPPASDTPEPEPSTLQPPPNSASKGVMSYGMIGVTMMLMSGVMT